ncbi:glutaminase [Psychroflexus sp. CAK57W]|uniref:glutaminase n=1 Tax=Psychroflexus curvus TaxID=2873595 RepID=UPI001CCE2EB4|nr:glutaminase [Psychroflexus curvus]MBZ9627489.1 glutaminase [Psychroflexus curvus]MBZ9785975.1 glutaminase [Psychroflexus curvus]
MDYQAILNVIEKEFSPTEDMGNVAAYIPELSKVNPLKFGVYLFCQDGSSFEFGDSQEKFSIQSVSKVFTLTIAKELLGKDLWKRVNVEPSGTPFNSLTELERESGIPRNPFINAGSIVVADALLSVLDNPKRDLLKFVRKLCGDDDIHYDEAVARSEKKNGYRNKALVNYMKALGNIDNDTDEILDFYFYQCSIAMNCDQLSKAFMLYANEGKHFQTQEKVIDRQSVKRINSIMQTCGFYDEAGEFSFRVGLPGKSGVGGGIVAVHPEKYSVAVWSPMLNEKGNSALGMKVLERLTTLTGFSIF